MKEEAIKYLKEKLQDREITKKNITDLKDGSRCLTDVKRVQKEIDILNYLMKVEIGGAR